MTWSDLGFAFFMAAVILLALLAVDYVGATMDSAHEYRMIFAWTALGVYVGRIYPRPVSGGKQADRED